MQFNNLEQNFTDHQKLESFLYLQKFILDKQSENKPFFIGRLSGNESRLAGLNILKKTMDLGLERDMLDGAGIQFLNKEDINNYVKLYNDSVKNCHVLGIWSSLMYQQAILYYKIKYNQLLLDLFQLYQFPGNNLRLIVVNYNV